MNILVTCSAGFIGSNLVKRLFKEMQEGLIVGIDNLNNYYDVSLVESTVGNCLNTVIREMESECCKYGDLIEPIQVASLAAYDYKLMECDSKDRRGKLLKQQTDFAAVWSVIKQMLNRWLEVRHKVLFLGALMLGK